MTSMAFPRFDMKQMATMLGALEKGVKQTEKNGGKISEAAADNIRKFTGALENSEWFRPSFAKAIRDTIAKQDGRYYPWGLTDGSSARVRENSVNVFDRAYKLADLAPSVDKDLNRLKDLVDSHIKNKNLSGTEVSILSTIIEGLQAATDALDAALKSREKLAPSLLENLSAGEITDRLKTKVNMRYNDIEGGGPFGLWVKFDTREANAFVSELKKTGLSPGKAMEVVQQIYDEASSQFGNLVLTAGAAKSFAKLSADLGVDLDAAAWNKAVDVSKNDHPMVALYAVAIREALAAGDRAELAVMLRAGRAAVAELGADFIRNGPRPLGGASMPTASAAFATGGPNATAEARGAQVKELEKELDKIAAFLGA